MFQHHRIRNAQQSKAEGAQIIFFGGIFAHLVDLSVDAALWRGKLAATNSKCATTWVGGRGACSDHFWRCNRLGMELVLERGSS
jgi:hypothetical protein